MDLAGHLPLVGPGAPQQHRQLPFQGEETGLVQTAPGPWGGGSFPAAVSVFVHVSPASVFPVLNVLAKWRRRRSSASISQA
ncbi:hypothetical protein GCM10010266_17090 [Streptomyces griseomycini]|nr:hypothetical protein GCM10010266_17090 [Streptomyces griseomycini]